MRKLVKHYCFEVADILLGIRASRTYKQNKNFFREFNSPYLEGDNIQRIFPIVVQALTTSAIAYSAFIGHYAEIFLPVYIKSLVYFNFRGEEKTTLSYRRQLLEEVVSQESISEPPMDSKGEEWKLGTDYNFSDDL